MRSNPRGLLYSRHSPQPPHRYGRSGVIRAPRQRASTYGEGAKGADGPEFPGMLGLLGHPPTWAAAGPRHLYPHSALQSPEDGSGRADDAPGKGSL